MAIHLDGFLGGSYVSSSRIKLLEVISPCFPKEEMKNTWLRPCLFPGIYFLENYFSNFSVFVCH